MTYTLGRASRAQLEQVKPELVRVVEHAIVISDQDFTVYDGARTLAEQERLVHNGHSQTLRSKHLIHGDGFGWAVDLVPWIDGRPNWAWPAVYKIALAMQKSSIALAVPVTWGCVWDRLMSEYAGDSPEDMKQAGLAYNARHPGSDFPDGPHFQYGRN